ncbi:hypothetical protein ES707_22174 [subsurface metagenome]
MEIAVKDDVRYLPHKYRNEDELENLVKEHVEFIFGNNSLFFEKSKIKSSASIVSIPDGFVLLPLEEKWYVIEVELSKHPLHDHIVPQILKFFGAIKNSIARKKLVDTFYEEIESKPILNYKYKIAGIKKERYKLLTDVINKNPEFAIIIDEKTRELEEICESLPFTSKVIEFRTYQREGSNVSIYIFDALYSPKKKLVSKPRKMIIRSDTYEIRHSYDILVNTAEWLIKKVKLRKENCPIVSGHKRNLVNFQPKHRYGDSFRAQKKLSNGLYIETHYSTASCINNARKLLERCGYSKNILELKN